MNFLAVTSSSAWVLLAAAALLVLGLYLLRPSPRRIAISSHLIWARVLKSRKRDPDRLRWWISLLLAMLIALACALAFTQPEWAVVSGGAKRVIVVLDNSASLLTRTRDGKSRWEHAVSAASSAIEGAGAGSEFMVLDVLHQAGSPAWETSADALVRLRKLKPALGAASFPIVPEADAGGRRMDYLFITDGVAPIAAPSRYRTQSVFEPATNLGIAAFEVRPYPADPRRQEAYLEVFNASSGSTQAELTIMSAGSSKLSQQVVIPGNSAASVVAEVSSFPPGPVRASVASTNDAFELDNVAFSFVPAKTLLRVGLVTRGNPVLERALRLQARLSLTVFATPSVEGNYDAVIFDRLMPTEKVAFPALLIRPHRAPWLPASQGEIREASINIWDRQHPVMEHLSLRDVVVDRAIKWKAEDVSKARAVVLASDAAQGPLIIASASEPRWLATSFDLSDTNLALQPGFPVLLSNSLHWLTGESQALTRSPGWVEVPATMARVVGLDGREAATRTLPGAVSFEAPGPGFYTVVTPDRTLRVGVNLFDMSVTSINRSNLANASSAPSIAERRFKIEPWMLLLFIALTVLSLEWVTYHHRLTV